MVIPTEGERRQQILTLFSYANGAIVFAEADIAARPGRINRVLLDVPESLRLWKGGQMKNASINLSIRVVFAVFLILVGVSVTNAQLVNIATDATDPSNLKDHEPSIAVNPLNALEIVVTTFSEGWGPDEPAPVWRSTDGGATWTKIFILPQPDELSTGICDQKPSFDGSGNLHIAIWPRCARAIMFCLPASRRRRNSSHVGERYRETSRIWTSIWRRKCFFGTSLFSVAQFYCC